MSDKKIPIDPVHLTELIRNPVIVRIVSIPNYILLRLYRKTIFY